MRLSTGLWTSRSGQTRERLGNFTRVWKDGGSKGDLQIDEWQHTEGCSTASVTRETQVQMTQHFTPTGTARIRKPDGNKWWGGHGEIGPSALLLRDQFY